MDPRLPFPQPRNHAEEIENIHAWAEFDRAIRRAPIRPNPTSAAPVIVALLAGGITAALIALWVLA